MVNRSTHRDRDRVPRSKRSRLAGNTRRGQAFTLEAFVASLLLLTAIVVTLGSTAVTPLSASGSSQQVGTQQAAMADGVLDAAASKGSLRPALLFWDDTVGEFHGVSDDGDYTTGGPPNEFGDLLDRSFGDRDVAYNVNVRYIAFDADGKPTKVEAVPMVTMGRPSETGVRAVEWVTLYDDDTLYAADETPTTVTLAESTTFYAPDVDPDGRVYNVIRVEVVVWRV